MILDPILLLFPNIYGPNFGLYKKISCQITRISQTKIQEVYQNVQIYPYERPKGQPTSLQPYVIDVPLNLIGRYFTYGMANSNIYSTFFLVATSHLISNTIIKVTWKNDEPIWTEQWPLTKNKLEATKELIDTQLKLKYIEESYSPWNSPIFVVKKKLKIWHLLTDVRKVNGSMKPMGVLQPEIPSPNTVPQNWHIILIDFQDCFFTIPLHTLDQERFAFSLPYPNHIGPHKWYQWTILPQGMMNSPTICQYYVAKALEPIRKQFPNFIVIHYMDNILFSTPSVLETQQIFDITQ